MPLNDLAKSAAAIILGDRALLVFELNDVSLNGMLCSVISNFVTSFRV
jgi:hypothetical protein